MHDRRFHVGERRREQIFLAFSCSSWSSLDPPLGLYMQFTYSLWPLNVGLLLFVERETSAAGHTRLKRVCLDVSWDGCFVEPQVSCAVLESLQAGSQATHLCVTGVLLWYKLTFIV